MAATSVKIGDFVATRLSKYDDEIPQIGRVLEIMELDVTIEWWIGRYSSTWNVWKTNDEPNKETIPKNAIIRILVLTKSQRIHKNDIVKLKQIYENIELM